MKKCKQCNKELKNKNNTFCNRSCSAIYNNKKRIKKDYGNCLFCNNKLQIKQYKFCSNFCQKENERKEYLIRWKEGKEKGWSGATKKLSNYIRNYMLEKTNYACEKCGWNEVHPCDGNPLVEIDHIDGNASNCSENNLRVLCPNCHSMTPTFRSRNKTSVRIRN